MAVARSDQPILEPAFREALIVEDCYHAAVDLARQLQDLGCHALVANGASSAIAVAARSQPEIAFIDINLDGGFEGLDVAREIERRTGASIVFVTGYNAEDLKGRLEPFRNAVMVFKPVNRSTLQAALRLVSSARAEPVQSAELAVP
jgi:CheY-like chemotaxis protein